MAGLTKAEILRLFELLNERLAREKILGEVYLVGGAVMCLVFEERPATKDIDAFFKPASKIRQLANEIGSELELGENWLNDAVKGFLSDRGTFQRYLKESNLTIYCAQPDYLLAMKCLAMRIGEEFHDVRDVSYLLRYLNISNYDQAISCITKYYPLEKFPQKTLYALEELLGDSC